MAQRARPQLPRAEQLPTDAYERAARKRATSGNGDPDDVLDREDARRSEPDPASHELIERHLDDLAGLDTDDRVEDDACLAGRDIDQVCRLELRAAPDLQELAQLWLEARQEVRRGEDRRAVVAAVGAAADQQPDGWRG